MIDNDFTLLDEMKECWGQTFEQLNNSERLWLLSSVIGMMTGGVTENYNPHDVSDGVADATERFDELSFYEQVALAEALIHQIKYHRYNR
ncbi:hypothetical protein PI95_030410 [Hassallia byssoidea VB512170]|uniref:Uncharacterized protein n=1 Tax=Hassallia byssoidea VB512170 TaxID=1304833 RepID=A0A846HH67_9CYAN|nr:hypothetical protein [Hassalia byssoidea]NEU76706.1 hypothetical protein [Hassalia byssoidea VB512170]